MVMDGSPGRGRSLYISMMPLRHSNVDNNASRHRSRNYAVWNCPITDYRYPAVQLLFAHLLTNRLPVVVRSVSGIPDDGG